MSEEKKWKVYCYTNQVNGKKYVGITSARLLCIRAGHGAHYKGSRYFYFAIQKHGWDNFVPEILADNLSQAEAERLERHYIAALKTQNHDFGYNIDDGGGVPAKVSPEGRESLVRAASGTNNKKARAIVAFDLTGRKIAEFPCIVFAEKHFGIKVNWHHVAAQKGTCHNMIFRFKEDVGDLDQLPQNEIYTRYDRSRYRREKSGKAIPVVLFDANSGKRIKQFSCIKDAGEYAGVSLTNVLNGKSKTAAGYVCKRLSEVENLEYLPKNELPVHLKTTKEIFQFDLSGNFIRSFQSGIEAEKITGVNHKMISNCVRHLSHTGGGYIWRLSSDNSPIDTPKTCWETRWDRGAVNATPVDQIDLKTGEVIASYRSISDAAKSVGTYVTSIRQIIDHVGNHKSAKGYGWRYHIDNNGGAG